MEKETKNGKVQIIAIVILSLIVLGLVYYISTNQTKEPSLTNENETKQDVKYESSYKLNGREFAISDIESYLNDIPYVSEDITKNYNCVYSNDKKTMDNIDKECLVYGALRNSQIRENDGFKTNELLEIIKDKYNKTDVEIPTRIEITEGNFDLSGADKYTKNIGKSGYGQKKYSKIIDVKYEDGKLVIYEKASFLKGYDGRYEYEFYKEDTVSNKSQTSIVTVYSENQASEYFYNNTEKFNTYKHTFELGNEQAVYWQSTELSK